MARKRRVEFLFSIILVAAGASLLIYAGASWLLPAEAPPTTNQPAPAEMSDLPPALLPAPAIDNSLSADPPAADELENSPLLPESPLVQEEETADLEQQSAAALSESNSAPNRIVIPALDVDAPVYAAGLESRWEGDREYVQWSVPDAYAAGWHENSAALGQVGNMVLNGHNNVYGGIFADLSQLAVGEQIILRGENGAVVYRVVHHELLQERGLSLRERLRNAHWIGQTEDQRLTLVTCWPNTTNSHRLIVVAEPAGVDEPAAGAANHGDLIGQIAYLKE
jgi:sortase A